MVLAAERSVGMFSSGWDHQPDGGAPVAPTRVPSHRTALVEHRRRAGGRPTDVHAHFGSGSRRRHLGLQTWRHNAAHSASR